jgi:hypothetical protein
VCVCVFVCEVNVKGSRISGCYAPCGGVFSLLRFAMMRPSVGVRDLFTPPNVLCVCMYVWVYVCMCVWVYHAHEHAYTHAQEYEEEEEEKQGSASSASDSEGDEEDSEEEDEDAKSTTTKQPTRTQTGSKGPKNSKRKKSEYGVSRGVDFRDVANVINFDFPLTIRAYVHRCGRTARGGE